MTIHDDLTLTITEFSALPLHARSAVSAWLEYTQLTKQRHTLAALTGASFIDAIRDFGNGQETSEAVMQCMVEYTHALSAWTSTGAAVLAALQQYEAAMSTFVHLGGRVEMEEAVDGYLSIEQAALLMQQQEQA